MSEKTKIEGYSSFLATVLLKPTWEFNTTGALKTVLFVGTWWRDNFASDAWKKKLELKEFLPNWHPAWWLCIGLAVLLLLAVRESYRLWAQQNETIEALARRAEIRVDESLPLTAPQVKLTSDRQPEMGSIERLILRNLTNDPICNLAFQPITLREGVYAIWKPSDIPVWKARPDTSSLRF